MEKLLNYLKYKFLLYLEFTIKFIIVFLIVPILSIVIAVYLDFIISDLLSGLPDRYWVDDLKSCIKYIEMLFIPLGFTFLAWSFIFDKSKDIVKPENYFGNSMEDIELKKHVAYSLSNVPIGVDFDTFCMIFKDMKGVNAPIYLGKEGDVYLYSFVLDIYINNTSSKKANFTVRFKDDLFIGYDNSELIRL